MYNYFFIQWIEKLYPSWEQFIDVHEYNAVADQRYVMFFQELLNN